MGLAIRVHDNARGIWFNPYPEGEQATVQEGAGNLTINLGVENTEPQTGRTWLRLTRLDPRGPYYDEDLIDYIAYEVGAYQWHNYEITTNMLGRNTTFVVDYWLAREQQGGDYVYGGTYSFIINYIANPNPPPDGGDDGGYWTQEECEAAGWYWYDNACHALPSNGGGNGGDGLPDIGLIVLAAGVIVLGVGVGWYLWKGRKKERKTDAGEMENG